MQILQSNDTVVKVKFLQPFKGYIKAAYENCTIADSLYIEVDTVYNIKTGVYLGEDTIQCIGKSITLNAGNGFKSYKWQNGSTQATFTTSTIGRSFVTVIDSCNNTFSDTITINPNPKLLQLTYNNTLCEYDTVKIILPNDLTNYSWQPVGTSLLFGTYLFLFPTTTTLYTVNAQSHNNCFISDTLLIKKKDCFASIYFPTAFTPNKDGINDMYKPSTLGILQTYSFTIFNRYGEVVFTTKNVTEGWDGKYKNKLSIGGYTWVCAYQFRNKKSEIQSGSFVLLR